MELTPATHPVSLSVDYPERELNRVTTAFRIFTIIPIAIVLGALGGTAARDGSASGPALLVVAPALMIVFREKYPRWWFDWNLQLLRFATRVGTYGLLLRDEYPATDDDQSVHLELPYPEGERMVNRWLPLVKWFLAIPHYVVLVLLWIAVFFVTLFAWFAILFTGRYPRGAFGFVEGVIRWHLRVIGYAFALVTDEYPPFSLAA